MVMSVRQCRASSGWNAEQGSVRPSLPATERPSTAAPTSTSSRTRNASVPAATSRADPSAAVIVLVQWQLIPVTGGLLRLVHIRVARAAGRARVTVSCPIIAVSNATARPAVKCNCISPHNDVWRSHRLLQRFISSLWRVKFSGEIEN